MIAAGLIVGAGETMRFLDRTLRLAAEWANVIFAVTDADADHDVFDALEYAQVTWLASEHRFIDDESALRNELLGLLDRQILDGTLVVMLDADEELRATKRTPRLVLRSLLDDPAQAWQAEFVHVWRPDGSLIRVDGGWAPAPQTRIYRHREGLRIPARRMACSAIPDFGGAPVGIAPLRFVHLGYARPEDRAAKYVRYLTHDGGTYHSGAHIDSILDPPELAPCP